ncbi:MAG: acyl-CoA dehydrogenase, partial [Xanthobacteraceae bacterium]
MSALNLPKPAWRTEEHDMLAESARAFLAKEFVPNLDRWSEEGVIDRDAWIKAAEAGLLSAS